MSLGGQLARSVGVGFPRTRGDEPPAALVRHTTTTFSPHARG